MRTKAACAASIATALALSPAARADGARDWENVPIDTNILFAYYTYSNTEASVEPELPIEGVSVDASVPILRYARTFALGSNVGGFQLIAPYGFVKARLQGTSVRRSTSGLGDISAVVIANLAGAPALTRAEFARWTPAFYLTASATVTAPTGRYDEGDPLNVGKHRWSLKPQLSYGKYLPDGLLFAVNANAQWFTANNAHRGGKLEQRTLYGVEAHLSKDLGPRAWASVDLFHANGGETSVAGVDKENRQRTWRLGVSGSYRFNAATASTAALSRTIAREDYTPAALNFSINVNTVF